MIRRRNAHEGDSPTVLWWIKDWLTSETVLSMPRAARSLYFDLLLRQASEGSIPADTRVLAALCGESHGAFLKLWQHVSTRFTRDEGGRLRNPRMEAERKADEEYRAARAAAGAKGAAKRWHGDGSAMHPATDLPGANGCPSSSSSSPSEATLRPPGKPADGAGESGPSPGRKPRAEPTGPQAECAAHWRSEWARCREGTRCATLSKEHYVLIAWMLQQAEPENVRRRMTAILEDREEFVRKKASLKLLRAQWDNYALAASKPSLVRTEVPHWQQLGYATEAEYLASKRLADESKPNLSELLKQNRGVLKSAGGAA